MSEDLPDGWTGLQLASVASLVTGSTPSTKSAHFYDGGTVPFVKPGDLGTLRPITAAESMVTLEGAAEGRLLPPGSSLVCCIGSIGKLGFLGCEAIANQQINAAIPGPAVLPRYLFHALSTINRWLDEHSSETTIRIINKGRFSEAPIRLAPLPEQHRIVEKVEALLEQVNRAKARLDRVPLILKRFRQAVLAAACSGELTREWRQNHKFERSAPALVEDIWEQRARSSQRSATLGPPATEAVKNLDGWCETRIGDVVDCLDNIRRPINKDERANRTGNIPYFGANGQVGWIDSYLFDEDLVLVVEDETFVGREKPFSYVVRGKTWVNNHAHVLRPLGGMSAEYLDTCLAFYNFVPLTSGTTGRRKLTKAALLSAPICVAPLAEQQEIVRLTTALFSLADTIERRVQAAATRANKLPQAILSKAFSGELVPTEAELARLEGRTYETAEELLKRVTALGSDAPVAGKGRGRRARKAE